MLERLIHWPMQSRSKGDEPFQSEMNANATLGLAIWSTPVPCHALYYITYDLLSPVFTSNVDDVSIGGRSCRIWIGFNSKFEFEERSRREKAPRSSSSSNSVIMNRVCMICFDRCECMIVWIAFAFSFAFSFSLFLSFPFIFPFTDRSRSRSRSRPTTRPNWTVRVQPAIQQRHTRGSHTTGASHILHQHPSWGIGSRRLFSQTRELLLHFRLLQMPSDEFVEECVHHGGMDWNDFIAGTLAGIALTLVGHPFG